MRTNRQYKSTGISARDVINRLIAEGYKLSRHDAPAPKPRHAKKANSRRVFDNGGTKALEGGAYKPKASVKRQARETQEAIQKILGGPLDAVVSLSGLSVYFNKTDEQGRVRSVAVPVKGHVVPTQIIEIERETGLVFQDRPVAAPLKSALPKAAKPSRETKDGEPDNGRRRAVPPIISPWVSFGPSRR